MPFFYGLQAFDDLPASRGQELMLDWVSGIILGHRVLYLRGKKSFPVELSILNRLMGQGNLNSRNPSP